MKSLSLYLSLTFFLSQFSFSQDYRLFHDDFTTQTNHWEIVGTEGGKAKISGDNLNMNGGGGYLKCLHEVLMQANRGFTLDTRFTINLGAQPESFGLLWSGGDRMDRYYAFLIKPEGYFGVVEVFKGEETLIIPWKRYRKIKGQGEENQLTLKKNGWKLTFLINGKEVADTRFKKFFGKYQGFILRGRGSVSIDEFTLRHPPIPLSVMDGNYPIATKRRLDSTVNSPDFDETDPMLAPNKRTLYFTRKPKGADWNQGNIWVSHVQGDTMWGEPAKVFPLNNEGRNAVAHFYPDRKNMLLSSHYQPDGADRGTGVAVTSRDGNRSWRKPVNMIVPKLTGETSPETYFLSQDGKILLMSIEKSDGYGDLDLYVSFNRGGNWTSPKNLGPSINTYGMDVTPYLDDDGETLYFSSTGHPGYGKADVYMSKRTSNTWTQWTKPTNLGARINGIEWDGFYTPIKKDEHAYMASRDSVNGDFVLYGVRIPHDMRTQPVVRIYGRVLNKKTNEPLGGLITFKGLDADSSIRNIRSHSEYGNYSMYLPFGRPYQLFAEKIGYFAQVDTLDLRRFSVYRDLEKDLYLSPIEVGQTITLNRVFFKRARAELLEPSYAELDRLVLLMRSLPSLQIEIRGHTDNIGQVRELQQLSEARAGMVKKYLTDQGISANRTSSAGFGGTRPIASNENPATRVLNRRVEFLIISR